MNAVRHRMNDFVAVRHSREKEMKLISRLPYFVGELVHSAALRTTEH